MWSGSDGLFAGQPADNASKTTSQLTQGKSSNQRSANTRERLGQITPPDDDLSAKYPDDEEEAEQARTTSASKSQRARNAANSRHAKKKARKDSGTTVKSDDNEMETGDKGDVEEKREKYREKNRVAAAKCRAKKKENVDAQEESHRGLSAYNTFLRHTEQSLRDELTFWRTKALQHTDCGCSAVQNYNLGKAHELSISSQMGGVGDMAMGVDGTSPDGTGSMMSPPDSDPSSSMRTHSLQQSHGSFANSSPSIAPNAIGDVNNTGRQEMYQMQQQQQPQSRFAFAPAQTTATIPQHSYQCGPGTPADDSSMQAFFQGQERFGGD